MFAFTGAISNSSIRNVGRDGSETYTVAYVASICKRLLFGLGLLVRSREFAEQSGYQSSDSRLECLLPQHGRSTPHYQEGKLRDRKSHLMVVKRQKLSAYCRRPIDFFGHRARRCL